MGIISSWFDRPSGLQWSHAVTSIIRVCLLLPVGLLLPTVGWHIELIMESIVPAVSGARRSTALISSQLCRPWFTEAALDVVCTCSRYSSSNGVVSFFSSAASGLYDCPVN